MDEQERRRIWAKVAAYYGNPAKEPPEPDLELSETDTGFYERISKNAEGAEAENASGGRARRTLQVGDRTYDYEVVPSAEQSAQAKQTANSAYRIWNIRLKLCTGRNPMPTV